MTEESNQSLANQVVMIIQSWSEKAKLSFFLNIQYLDSLSEEKELLCKVSHLVNGDKKTLGFIGGCGGVKLIKDYMIFSFYFKRDHVWSSFFYKLPLDIMTCSKT